MKTTHTNETKHTPGPWETARSHSGRNIYKQTQRDFDTKETRMLAFLVRNEDYFPVEESDANARLIAAAPELLAALERFAKWYGQNSMPELQGVACDAFQAIAKAKGGA
jgi:hypothetical protein